MSSPLPFGTRRGATPRLSGPYTPDANRRVKEGVDRGIYVSGSGTLVRALLADGLVDELHLFMFPVTRGQGPRLFPADGPRKWSLTRSDAYDSGVLYLQYRAVD